MPGRVLPATRGEEFDVLSDSSAVLFDGNAISSNTPRRSVAKNTRAAPSAPSSISAQFCCNMSTSLTQNSELRIATGSHAVPPRSNTTNGDNFAIHSFSNPWLSNFSVRLFSVTVRTS
jgi:hypothetical protein